MYDIISSYIKIYIGKKVHMSTIVNLLCCCNIKVRLHDDEEISRLMQTSKTTKLIQHLVTFAINYSVILLAYWLWFRLNFLG